MKLDRAWHSKRRAVAGIVASVFMFAMLFTVGASYFLFVNQNNMLYSQAASVRATALSNQQSEDLTITAGANSSTNALYFTAQDLGAATATITALFVLEANGSVLAFCQVGSGGSCPSLPFSVNQGTTSGRVATGVIYSSPNTYTVSVVTQLGNVFTATYPPTATSLASQALSSGAIGDLYLSFQSYTYYQVVTAGTSLPGGNICPSSSSTNSGYCLLNKGSAFTISSGFSGNIAFSITTKNLNPEQLSITLDQYSSLLQLLESGNGAIKYIYWYIGSISNQTNSVCSSAVPNTICKSYTGVTLTYNQPQTVVFESSVANSPGSRQGVPGSGTAPVFIISHGWLGNVVQQESSANYGQNSPYVTTLYD